MSCFTNDTDRNVFLGYLRECLEDAAGDFALHAYVLMTNHVHLLATGVREGIVPALMQRIGTRYARYFNAARGRTGPLFGSRYWSSLVETERYFLATMRYIELNPVRAVMVESPEEYPWSSYRNNVGRGRLAEITFHGEYLSLGATPVERARAWEAIVNEGIAPWELSEIRSRLSRGHPLASPSFLEKLTPVPGTVPGTAISSKNPRP